MNAHISGLVTVIAVQLGAIFADQTTPWPAKIANVIATLFTLVVVDRAKQAQVTTIILGLVGVLVPVLGFALTKMTAGSMAATIATTGIAVFVRLPALLAAKNDSQIRPDAGHSSPTTMFMLALAALAVASAILLLPGRARAEINLDDIAPKVTKCWGTTCLMPTAAVNAVLFDLKAKKWEAGSTSLGAGMVLMLAADQVYGSGVSLRVTGVLSQQGPSFAMPTVGIVAARYFEVGLSYRITGSGTRTPYLGVAGNIPWDIFGGITLPERATRARLGRQE